MQSAITGGGERMEQFQPGKRFGSERKTTCMHSRTKGEMALDEVEGGGRGPYH